MATPRKRGINPRIAIIGGGMSGLLCGIKLQEAGLKNFTIYEKSEGIGGTWHDNKYPGLACDVPSHAYSYSFAPNPNWSKLFAEGPEILAYLKKTAKDYEIEPYLKLNCEISRCEFKAGQWQLSTNLSPVDTADFVICATGVLHHPIYPDIPGLDTFQGKQCHSARWDDSIVLNGKRVGIIGNGSSGVQIIDAIVDQVDQLAIFQRTPQWIFPQANPSYSDEDKEKFRKNPQQMNNMHKGLLDAFENSFATAVIDANSDQIKVIENTCRNHIEESIKDPRLKKKLTPNYRAACKRLIVSDTFYQSVQKPNVSLITDGIEKIEPQGVLTQDGKHHPLDVLILATGFDAHQFMRPMEVIGRNELSLKDAWSQATAAYRSIAVPNFPNFFTLIGPNSPVGNFSLIDVAETQLAYILQLIGLTQNGRDLYVEPKQSATDKFNAALIEATKDTIWVTGCNSWYLTPDGVPATWPWSVARFREEMEKPALSDFKFSPQ